MRHKESATQKGRGARNCDCQFRHRCLLLELMTPRVSRELSRSSSRAARSALLAMQGTRHAKGAPVLTTTRSRRIEFEEPEYSRVPSAEQKRKPRHARNFLMHSTLPASSGIQFAVADKNVISGSQPACRNTAIHSQSNDRKLAQEPSSPHGQSCSRPGT